MLPRRPAEPDRTSLTAASTGGPAIFRRRAPARHGTSADHHGISWWLRRLSRYHGCLRAGWDGSCPGREEITKLLATKPGPVMVALLAHAHASAYRTAAPRCRPALKPCCGGCLNEAGRPAASIQDGSSMLELLPRFLLFLQRTATDIEGPHAWPPSQHGMPVNDGTASSVRNFTECSVDVLDWLF